MPQLFSALRVLGRHTVMKSALGVSFWPDQMRFERIGSYDVTAPIGVGGMGQVYQATDTTCPDPVPQCDICRW